MIFFEHIGAGFQLVSQPSVLLLIVIGTVVGICVGAIPGLTAMMAIAMAVPITYSLGPMEGLSLLISIYVGGMTGGLVSAILLNIPGTPSSIATTFDGYPLAAKGEPGRALGYGITASFLGGGFSYLCLLFLAPSLAEVALTLSPFEIFAIVMCALVMIADTSQSTLSKALTAGCLGLFAGTVGPDPIVGVPRFDFDSPDLGGGFVEVSVLIGLFAVPQLLSDAKHAHETQKTIQATHRNILPKLRELKESVGNLVRSSLIGTWIGLVPGVGASTASLLAYNQAKLASKHPENFGKGVRDGIFASEAANNAVTGGSQIPLLTLGIPGCPAAALLLSGLTINNLVPGPLLFTNSPDITYGFILAFMVSNVVMFGLMIILIKPFAMVLRVPKYLLIPPILAICVMGAYVTNNRFFDIWVVFGFGLLGYWMEKHRYPLAPMVLGIILGPIAEMQLRRGLTASKGSFMPLLERPVCLAFLLISVVIVIYPFVRDYLRKRRVARAEESFATTSKQGEA
jgi:putative tricarboxylic transport membrane protein